MNRRDLIVLFTALVALPLPTPAQKIPLEGDRVVQLHDVGDMVRVTAAASGPRVQPEMSPADVEEYERNQLERMAELLPDHAKTHYQLGAPIPASFSSI